MSRTAILGGALLALFALVAVFAPLLAPFSPLAYSGAPLEPPSLRHLLGTDGTGQDILSQLIYGGRVSLLVGLCAALGGIMLGAGLGMAAGVYGGLTDRFVMRFVDIFLTIPHLPLMVLLAAHFRPQLSTTIAVLIFFSLPVEARLVRSQVLSLRQREFLDAARLAGATKFYLLRRYILPELVPLLLAQVVIRTSWAILAESGLAFLGLGDPTAKSWGIMLKQALDYQAIYFTPAWQWWLLPPGLCITALIMALTTTGYALEEKFNPTLSEVKR
ncbi:ABC transporter permease [Anaeroselena agilis]|uniref:ABC transporter permease n=1 Tax=Anaeroselena agilis TaxID=3063788 RepID=A0ABU3NZD7_9FIRM|nr:ABC transporter permease [Selenomonadales bacterium 4137-cl]